MRLAHNWTSDLKQDEVRKRTGRRADKAKRNFFEPVETKKSNSVGDPPMRIDHREFMSAVRDQGTCGSCFAHAAASVLEGALALKKG